MDGLPVRGPGVRSLGLPLPPARMPRVQRWRPLKRWRYAGIYGPGLMLCAGDARVGPLQLRWWAAAEPGRPIVEHTWPVRSGGLRVEEDRVELRSSAAEMELALEPDGDPVEVVSPSGRSWIWTRKAPVRARGRLLLGGRERDVDARGLIDESAGYHERRTAWRWSAGVGEAASGESVAWNLVAGVHDGESASERTVWVGGEPREVRPVAFEPRLGGVDALRFSEWSARVDDTNLLLFRSRYRQPFGTFEGELPGGPPLAAGYGVMEEHDALW